MHTFVDVSTIFIRKFFLFFLLKLILFFKQYIQKILVSFGTQMLVQYTEF